MGDLEKEIAYLKDEMIKRLEKKDLLVETLQKDVLRANNETARMKKFFMAREEKLEAEVKAKEVDIKQFLNDNEHLQKKLEDVLRYYGGTVNTSDKQRGVLQKYIKK